MKLRQISFKLVSMLMVMTLLFSTFATTISAAVNADFGFGQDKESNTGDKTINYVSFGASNVNGFGLQGYLPDKVEDFSQKDDFNVYGYKRAPEGSYPALLVEYFESKGYNVNLDQLAMSSMRAEEVRVLLTNDYAGDAYTDWRFNGHNGWYHGAGKLAYAELNNIEIEDSNVQDPAIKDIDFETALEALRQVYQQDVANADIITWDCGTNNFGVYLSGRVVDGSYDETIEDLSPEIAEKYEETKSLVFEIVKEKMGEEAFANMEAANVEHIVDSLAYCLVAYCVNYDIVMGRIFELNPEVQVITVSVQNLMKGLVATVPGIELPGVGAEIPLGDIINGVIDLANLYMSVGSPYADKTLYVDVSEDQHVTYFIDQLAAYNGDPTALDRDMINCWRIYNGGNMLAAFEPFCFDDNGKLVVPTSGIFGLSPEMTYDLQLVVIDTIAKYMQVGGKLNVLDFGCLAGGDWGQVSDTGMGAITGAVTARVNDFIGFVMSGGNSAEFPYATVSDDFWEQLAIMNGIDVSLMNTFAAYGVRTFIGNAFYAHPNRQGCKEIADEIIKVYEANCADAEGVISDIKAFYEFAKAMGLLESMPEVAIVEEIYQYLSSNGNNETKYITDNQTLSILRRVYAVACDEEFSQDDLIEVCKCVYVTLIRNASLGYADKLAIIGNIYFILKNNEYLTGITALTVVEELYTALAAENLITDEQSYLIVDYVYDVIIDGTVTDADLLNIVRFVYNLLIKGGNARSNDQAKAARTIRVIFAVISETYLNEENKASVEKLITGDDALINDQLLLKIADEALIVYEENQGSDDLTAKLVDTVADTVLNDPNTDPSVKVQIVDEFVKIAENNGALGTEDESVLELKAAGKIYQRLKDAGLLTDAQVMSIITYLYPILVSGEELTDEQVVDIVAYVYDVVFGRDDLTLEDKIDIVVIVYEVLEEEGYVTEENINLVIDAFVDYIENNYEEIYANAHTELRNNGTIAELNAALDAAVEALVVARDVVDSYTVIDTLIEAKARLLKEIDLVDATIAQIKVLVNYETITAETLETLEVLLVYLNEHLDNITTLSAQVGTVALDQVVVVLELTDAFIQEFTKAAYAYILETAPVLYEQLVDYITDAIAEYSHEAAKLAYNWLINNPDKVIGFFDVYGDDIADFIVDYYQIIFGVLGYVGMTYGEDIFYLVLDNADVILPAVAGWFEIHGDLVWDLIVVYFNAIVEYYNLGLDLDFSSPEGIHASLNKIFALLGELLAMVKDGVYDYLEALGIIEQINKQLAALDAQIRHQINTAIDAINAYVEEKIAELTDYINKQIEILKEQLKNASDELKAEIEKQIEALEKELENLVNAEIENAEDLVAVLDALLQKGTFALGEFIYDAIVAYVNDAIRGEFTPNEETIYVSVNSGDAYYAELLADALANVAKGDITFENTVWGDLNYDLLASADLITIGYNESELTAFAIAQLLGYVHNYVDGDIRVGADNYLADVYATFDAYITEVKDTFANLGADIDFDFDPYKELVSGEVNGIIDVLAGNTTVPAEYKELLGEEYFELLNMANGLIGDATVSELDWAKYVGEDNLHYVDELRAAIRDELLAQGIVDTYTVEIPVVEYVLDAIFGDNDSIKLDGTIVTLRRDVLESKLAEVATHTITVPVVDTLVFAIESYIYSNVEFNYNYGKLIVDLYEINPDATVILLGHYNAFDFELGFGGESIDLGGLYNYVAQINSVQPFAYALLSEKVAYVDISDAETYYESFINAGVDNSLINFVIAYLNDSSITDVTEAGNVYIYEQIMSILTLNCDHVYDNACDIDCNKCGAIREVAGHVYVDGVCIHCGAIDPNYTPDAPDAPTHNFHVFDDCNDATCNECSYVRVVIGHVYDDCVDATCYMCDYVRDEVPGHAFGNCGEDTCSRCGKTRPATTHVYNNACDADCNRCGVTREVPAHVYSGCTDANCNVCGEVRAISAHKIDNPCVDNVCKVCGQNVAVNGHRFGAWTTTVEPTRKTEGQQARTCTGCGLVETATIDALGGIGGGAIAAIATGSVAVSGAGGFGIYWFLLQKKTFAQLLAALGKGAVETAAIAGEAAAEAGAVAAEAAAEAGAEAAEAVAEAAETIAE